MSLLVHDPSPIVVHASTESLTVVAIPASALAAVVDAAADPHALRASLRHEGAIRAAELQPSLRDPTRSLKWRSLTLEGRAAAAEAADAAAEARAPLDARVPLTALLERRQSGPLARLTGEFRTALLATAAVVAVSEGAQAVAALEKSPPLLLVVHGTLRGAHPPAGPHPLAPLPVHRRQKGRARTRRRAVVVLCVGER